jgi:ribosomal protein S18 acetylase RimI-like enzyme
MEIKRCSDVSESLIFETFLNGFIDYPVKFPGDEAFFFERFFGAEGNQREGSFIALSKGKGFGLILGGIRLFDSVKTLRCGTMCVVPEFRGKKVAQLLWEAHRSEGIRQGCKQLFLEVLDENARAIRFYEKNGYEKRYILKYYQISQLKESCTDSDMVIEPIDFKRLAEFRRTEFRGLHINWQNEMDYIERAEPQIFGIYAAEHLIGACCIQKGNIFFLGVGDGFRGRGIGTEFVRHALALSPNGVRLSFSNNALLEGFCQKLGCSLNPVLQHEMYQVL